MSIDEFDERAPSWLNRESIVRMAVAEQITSLSPDSLRRNFPHLIVKLSPRRDGIKLKDALAIADGTARRS